MIKDLANKTYKSLYSLPPAAKDLEEFGVQVLKLFVEQLKKNQQGVAWNSGFDGVVFVDKNVDGNKSLNKLMEEFLGQESNVSDPAVSEGTGAGADELGCEETGKSDQLTKST